MRFCIVIHPERRICLTEAAPHFMIRFCIVIHPERRICLTEAAPHFMIRFCIVIHPERRICLTEAAPHFMIRFCIVIHPERRICPGSACVHTHEAQRDKLIRVLSDEEGFSTGGSRHTTSVLAHRGLAVRLKSPRILVAKRRRRKRKRRRNRRRKRRRRRKGGGMGEGGGGGLFTWTNRRDWSKRRTNIDHCVNRCYFHWSKQSHCWISFRKTNKLKPPLPPPTTKQQQKGVWGYSTFPILLCSRCRCC